MLLILKIPIIPAIKHQLHNMRRPDIKLKPTFKSKQAQQKQRDVEAEVQQLLKIKQESTTVNIVK